MAWSERWNAVSARIEGLVRAVELLTAAFRVNSSDAFGVGRKWIVPEIEAIKQELRRLSDDWGPELPPAARASLDRFLAQEWRGLNATEVDIQAAVPFAVFRSQFDFLVRDAEAYATSLTELAFEHLRRVLAVDGEVRRKWQDAFVQREDHCERLGAVHLLSHGVWAFKVSAAGAATDLVFGEPIEREATVIRRTARALVLTEWKRVNSQAELNKKAEEARRQTDAYASGILSDVELRATRYIALVSQQQMDAPQDQREASVTFRHIVIPIAPETPSRQARRRSQPYNNPLQRTGAAKESGRARR